jgi:putative ABC transport system substrate-binding protein
MRWCLPALVVPISSAFATPRVAVVQSDDLDVYTAPVAAFLEELGEPALVVNLHGRRADADAISLRLRRDGYDCVFALGAKAAWLVTTATPDTPVVYASVLDPRRYGVSGPQVTGVGATVSPSIYLSQLTGFFPNIHKVGVLHGPLSLPARDGTLAAAAADVGVELVLVEAREPRDVRRAFLELAPQVDALWLQADREMLDAAAFRTLSEETRRRRIPLLVETENMVEAGALFAVVPDPAGVGRQAAELVARVLEGAAPAVLPVAPPQETRVVLSNRTARLAEIPLDPLLLDFVDRVVE